MLHLLVLVPAIPFAGAFVLGVTGRRLPKGIAGLIGVGTVAASAVLTGLIAVSFLGSPPPDHVFVQTLWQWVSVGEFQPQVTFYLDPLALMMIAVITGVGALIHLYSIEFMRDDQGFSRFFAAMNLFVGSMLVLVLAGDFLLLYLGWEGVGLCSYLLIGFWYRDPANGRAARKAFIVTRVGDTALIIGLFLLFWELGTLGIQDVLDRANALWTTGSTVAIAAAALLLGGAVGKSAQLPLQTWLPDAMAGPTPVSALIHAATMVTAGVYLIARTHPLFELAPLMMAVVAAIGAATLVMAGVSALVQRDIKRVLAYSTISQIGYMFLALGVGAWSAAIFHFMTHAFFKALLFLGAGAVILALHHENDITKMGGLWRRLPVTFWTFLIASASLAGLPLLTAGFYSKDLILWHAWASPQGHPILWAAGSAGALLTALYIFRVVFLVFLGNERAPVAHTPGLAIRVPLIVLAACALLAGFVEMPATLGGVSVLTGFLSPALAEVPVRHDVALELALQIVAGAVALIGIGLAYWWFAPARVATRPERRRLRGLREFWRAGWGFDRAYDLLLVRPFTWLARVNANDMMDRPYDAVAYVSSRLHTMLRATQTGILRHYAAAIAAGVILILGAVLLS